MKNKKVKHWKVEEQGAKRWKKKRFRRKVEDLAILTGTMKKEHQKSRARYIE